jgi:hypothetical protein
MNFNALVQEIQILSLPEKEEMKSLLDRYIAEGRRAEIVKHYRESRDELDQGKLEFSNDLGRLREILDD